MRTEYNLRKLGTVDAEAWAAIRYEAVEKHPFAFGAPLPDKPAMLVERFNRIITSQADETLIGASSHTEAEKQRHKADLWGMYVTPSHRGSGVGELLVHAAIDQASAWNGITQVHLSVSEVATEAKRLYEKVGFREWGREPRALCWQGQCVDYRHMVLQLK